VTARQTGTGDNLPESGCCGIEKEPGGITRVRLPQSLDTVSVGESWKQVFQNFKGRGTGGIVVDGRQLRFCDTAGLSFLLSLREYVQKSGRSVSFESIPEEIQERLEEFREFLGKEWHSRSKPPANPFVATGEAVHVFLKDLGQQITFLGELIFHSIGMLLKPMSIPWGEVISLSEKIGARGLGIVSLISFLIGLIMAFQSAIPMKQFGAELFVADLVGISLVRELGPLMTSILLAGRTGAAFAAELGTMKVNEEIDALTTMGLKPVRFLVVSRVMATVLMTPVLTAYADLMGLVGGGVVFCSFGFPLVTYLRQLDIAVTVVDFAGGTAKAFVFGFLVAAIGCLRGLQTRSGASAVGQSATSAVVSGIVLIVLADGIFSVVYYYLGI
jgi:phospholipid/cholesterol/gamma-HCH transport system permease protein